jgi:hypothetical protein
MYRYGSIFVPCSFREVVLHTSESSLDALAPSRSACRRAALIRLRRQARFAGAADEEIARAAKALGNTFALGDMLQSLFQAAGEQ